MEGVHEDVVLKNEEHMKEVNEKLEKLENVSCSQSIFNDLNREEMIFSEESSRVIYEMVWSHSNLGKLQMLFSAILASSTLRKDKHSAIVAFVSIQMTT